MGIFGIALKNDFETIINDHFEWGRRLKHAIESGHVDICVDDIRKDNICIFGEWLHGPSLSTKIKSLPEYHNVVMLHAKFHQLAAEAASLALDGNREEAISRLSITSDYASTSILMAESLMSLQCHTRTISDVAY